MRHHGFWGLLAVAWLGGGAVAQAAAVLVDVPVHGYLTNNAGIPLDGPVDMEFKLYPDNVTTPTPSPSFFTQTMAAANATPNPVSVVLGFFSTTLQVSPDDLGAHLNPYISIKVDGDPEMPRTLLGYAPFAAYSVK